jgi:cell wall-associated NlpC family hydrolase
VTTRIPALWWVILPMAIAAFASQLTTTTAFASPIEVTTTTVATPAPQADAPTTVRTPVAQPTTIKPKIHKVCDYRVRAHDWLSKIARKFDVPLVTLIARNPQFSDPDVILPGQHVHLCGPVKRPVSTVARELAADATPAQNVADTTNVTPTPKKSAADQPTDKSTETPASTPSPVAHKAAQAKRHVAPATHKVRKLSSVRVHSGDTLKDIAAQHHQSLVTLLSRNRRFWHNIHAIEIGQIVRLSGPKHHVPRWVIQQIYHVASAPSQTSTASTTKASPSKSTRPSSAPAPSRGAAAVLSFARAQLGEPYVYGATGPGSWDCSGLTQAAYRAAGKSIPRTSSAQSGFGSYVSGSNLRPGDLVFFYSPVSHVGIYVGHNTVLHAPHPGASVRYESMSYMPFAGARRP